MKQVLNFHDIYALHAPLFPQTRNAYLLVYERIVPVSEEAVDVPAESAVETDGVSGGAGAPSKAAPALAARKYDTQLSAVQTLPPAVLQQIQKDNMQLAFDQQIYSPRYIKFVYKVVSALASQAADSSEDGVYLRSLPVLEWATQFTLQVLAHYQDNSLLGDFVDRLISIYMESPQSCVWFVDAAAMDTSFALSVVVTASDKAVRTHIARLLVEAMALVTEQEKSFILDRVGGVPKSAVSRLLGTMFSLVPGARILFFLLRFPLGLR